jgi:hypothetical protein
MTTHIRLRRLVAALSIGVVTCTATALSAPSAHATRRSAIRTTVCDIAWQDGPKQVRRLIRCSARRWHVRGGPPQAVRVARCESRFRPKAYNPAGYAGVFQQSTHYWRRRARTYGFPRWSVYNGRANVIVSIRMAHRYGWGGWSCA